MTLPRKRGNHPSGIQHRNHPSRGAEHPTVLAVAVPRLLLVERRFGMSRKRAKQGREHPESRAHAIAEAVAAAWHRTYGAGRLDVPLCVVATVAAAPLRDVRGADTAGMMLTWTVEEFFAYSKTVWKTVVRRRPETVSLLYPLMAWIFQEPSVELRRQAHEVAMAAVRAEEVDLVGGRDRCAVDVLGAVLTVLRPPSAATERGLFYTPPDIADLMVRLSDVEHIGLVEDPAMGTGGMFRAAAVAMREAGRDQEASSGWGATSTRWQWRARRSTA
ncbi:N-6 DNA methylase [Kibdelosporangium lantanae]